MSIAFQCQCGKAGKVADSFAGKVIACPQCKGPVELPPIPPTSSPVAGPAPQPAPASGDGGMYEMAHIFGFLVIIFAGFAGIRFSTEYPFERFKSDNAYGAAANSLEDIHTQLNVWGWVFFGVSVIACSKLSRLIRILQKR